MEPDATAVIADLQLARYMVTERTNAYRLRLSGRTVSLVGGAPSANMMQAQRSAIIVHTNDHASTHGGPCDVLYTSIGPTSRCRVPRWVNSNLATPESREWRLLTERLGCSWLPFTTERFKYSNPYSPDLEWCNTLGRRLGTMPLTGIVAMHHLLMQPLKLLYVTGFTFYREDGIAPERRHSHALHPQEEYLYWLARNDSRVVLDETLQANNPAL